MAITSQAPRTASRHIWKLFVYSGIGAFMFFVPVTIAGKNTIMLDHIVSFLQASIGPVLPFYALAVIVAGAGYPFIAGTWKRSPVEVVF
jgi:nucleoside recognition membrane protein YjiH